MGYQKPTDIGIVSIADLGDGAMLVSLKNFINISMMLAKSPHSSLIRRLFGHIPQRQVLRKKNGGQAAEALGRSTAVFTTKTQCCGE